MDAVEVHREDGVRFVDRQVLRHAVDLSRARVNDAQPGIQARAFVDELQLRHGVQLGVAPRLLHAVDVADFAGEIEDDVAIADRAGKPRRIRDVAFDDRDLRRIGEITPVRAASRDTRIHHRHRRAETRQRNATLLPMNPRPPVTRTFRPRYWDSGPRSSFILIPCSCATCAERFLTQWLKGTAAVGTFRRIAGVRTLARAARCAAIFLVRPSACPVHSLPTRTSTVNVLECSGPFSRITA